MRLISSLVRTRLDDNQSVIARVIRAPDMLLLFDTLNDLATDIRMRKERTKPMSAAQSTIYKNSCKFSILNAF